MLIEGLSRRVRPRLHQRINRFSRYDQLRPKLDLEARYYIAQGLRGPVLIPYDSFLEKVETTLWFCTSPDDK